MPEKDMPLSEKESLALITEMISKARNDWYNTGYSAILWGALIAFCSLEKLAEIHWGYTPPFDVFLLTFFAVIPQIIISRREKKNRRFSTHHDTYQQHLWMTFGITIFLLIVIINVMANAWESAAEAITAKTGLPAGFHLYEYTSALFMLLYGIPTFITGRSLPFKPMIWGGLVCWICAIVSLFTPVEADLLLTALSAVVAWLIPGLILKKAYRSAQKGISNPAHV